jgi:hypothetical protein
MSGSDAEAVAMRRANLVSELAKLEARRVELLQEDSDLEVTERVLRRLGELHYGEPAVLAEAPPSGRLQSLLQRGLAEGRKALALGPRAAAKQPTHE